MTDTPCPRAVKRASQNCTLQFLPAYFTNEAQETRFPQNDCHCMQISSLDPISSRVHIRRLSTQFTNSVTLARIPMFPLPECTQAILMQLPECTQAIHMLLPECTQAILMLLYVGSVI
ncbi:hypothetical protein BsWGS_16008 [Bradybaena similaris]